MKRGQTRFYADGRRRPGRSKHLLRMIPAGLILIIIAGGVFAYLEFKKPATEASKIRIAASGLVFDKSITTGEKTVVEKAIAGQNIKLAGQVKVGVNTGLKPAPNEPTIAAYVPVMNSYTTQLTVTSDQLKNQTVDVPEGTDPIVKSALENALGVAQIGELAAPLDQLPDRVIAFIPAENLSDKVRLLTFNGNYYLDSFSSGAVFRTAEFSGPEAGQLNKVNLADLPTKADTLKVNMTGVTALARKYTLRIKAGTSPTFFSAKIADFLKDADIVHTSNEISFDDQCHLVDTGLVFCAMPSTIDTLKASGINLIELTGNHNNDFGTADDTATVEEYHKLGWHTFGGGLNQAEAAKPYVADMKGSKVAFLGYNYADSPDHFPIAIGDRPGANSWSPEKVKADVASAKTAGDYVIVDVQFFECYSYPTEHTEMPQCDQPIAKQEETFRQIIDDGADMVIGTQAHQPQTYEIYKGKQIYYGIGNLYFDQVEWPGTERGLILTHYFRDSKLLQTKLTPTIYGDELQVHQMTDQRNIDYFLNRLKSARATAGLDVSY